MNSSQLIQEVEAAGWYHVRTKGSHHQYKHPDHKLPLTIPHPKKDLGIGLVSKIKKQAGIR